MPQRDDLTGHLLFHVADESRGVVDPLRPRVDVAALPVAVAMPAKVDGVRGHPMPGHPARESFVAAAVLAKAVDDSEGDRSEERRVGKGGRAGWAAVHEEKRGSIDE